MIPCRARSPRRTTSRAPTVMTRASCLLFTASPGQRLMRTMPAAQAHPARRGKLSEDHRAVGAMGRPPGDRPVATPHERHPRGAQAFWHIGWPGTVRCRGTLALVWPGSCPARRASADQLDCLSAAVRLVSAGRPAGGRPRGRIRPAWRGSRPVPASARRSRNSIWALVLRSSSAAHLARASWTAGSSRSSTLLRSLTAVRCPWSLVKGAGVDDRLGSLLAAQDHQQV